MKKVIKVISAILAAAAIFAAGVFYTVYHAEIAWGQGANTTMTICLNGLTWEFPAYNACVHEEAQ